MGWVGDGGGGGGSGDEVARGHWVPLWEVIGCAQVKAAACCWHYFAARFYLDYYTDAASGGHYSVLRAAGCLLRSSYNM